MTVTGPPRNLAVAIFVTATLMPAAVAIAIISGTSDDTPSPAAKYAYVNQVAEHMYVIERDRQAFIAAGRDMCGIKGPHAEAASRRILVDHGLTGYAPQWKFVSTAAATYLC